MDPQRLGFGRGSPMIGNGGMVAQQMEQGAPALNQQGTNSPGFTPGQQMQPYPTLPTPSSAMPPSLGQQVHQLGMAPQPMAPMPQAPQMPQPQAPKSRGHLIIEALSNHLKHIADLETRIHDTMTQIQTPQAQQGPPPGAMPYGR